MSGASRQERTLVEDAAAWAVRLDEGALSFEERQALADWLRASPQHVKELLATCAVMMAAGEIDPEKRLSIEALIADARDRVTPLPGAAQDRPAPAEKTPTPGRRRNVAVMAGAAAILLSVTSGALLVGRHFMDGASSVAPTLAYATRTGEQRSLTLDDGSIIHLNTESDVRIRYGDRERGIDLFRGEALFEVARDPARPFRVRAGDTVAEALGTTFNVYRRDAETTVAVIEGKVAVRRLGETTPAVRSDPVAGQPRPRRVTLTGGELARVREDQAVLTAPIESVEAVTSWRARQLRFSNTPLSEIAAQFNRYNRVKLRIEGAELAAFELSANFDADDPQSLVELLETAFPVAAEHSREEIVLRGRAP